MGSKVFILPKFIAMSDNTHLTELFRQLGADVDSLSLEKCGKRECDAFYRLYEELAEEKRKMCECIMIDIYQFACSEGIQALNTVACLMNIDGWPELFCSSESFQYKAFAAWLNFRDLFYQASPYLDVATRRWVLQYDGLPKKEPEFDESIRELLESDIQGFLQDTEGRGKVCTVERIRHNGMIYFCAHPDDYAENSLRHDENRNLVPQVICKTFSFVFAVDPERGRSYLSASGGKEFKRALESVFLHLLYNIIPQEQKTSVDLQMLLDPQLSLWTRPEDRMKVRVKSLVICWKNDLKFTISIPPEISLRKAFEDYIYKEQLHCGRVQVIRAEFSFSFYDTLGQKVKTISIWLGRTESTDLLNEDRIYTDKIEHYFKLWGMIHDERHHDAAPVWGEWGCAAGQTAYVLVR